MLELGMLFQPNGAGSRLVVTSAVATTGSGITYDKVISGADVTATGALAIDQATWLRHTIGAIH